MFDTLLLKITEASLSPNVIATLIGAMATLLAAIIQLRLSWRREQAQVARPRKAPATQRRGPLLWLIVLILAAAVGGFAGAMYLIGRGFGDVDDIRTDLRQRIAQLSATAERIEKAGATPSSTNVIAGAHAGSATMASVSAGTLPAPRESAATITVAPCRVRSGDAAAAAACTEADALRVAVCAAVPANVKVPAATAYLRADDSAVSWTNSRAPLGQELVLARFAEQAHERTDADGERQMCLDFWSWHPDRTYIARLRVEAASHEALAAR